MTRDVEADVQINDKSSKGLGSFLANLRKADDKVKSTQKGIDKTTEATGKLGKEAEGNAKAFQKLSKELDVSKKELGSLAKAFADAGSAAERTDISKAMAKQQTEIRKLTKNRDILKDLLPSDKEVQKETKKFGQSLSDSFEGIGKLGGPALAIGIAGSAPAIGAVISGAIIGGAGAGGIVGGLLLTASDPRVGAVLDGFSQRFQQRLRTSAEPFVGVWTQAIGRVSTELDGINFEGLFADAAKEAGPLIDGVAKLIGDVGRGITDLVHNAGPAVEAIGEGIGHIGEAIGAGLTELSSNGKTSAQALTQLFDTIAAGTTAVFVLVDVLTRVYGLFNSLGGSKIQKFDEGILQMHQSITDAVAATYEQATASKLATSSVDQYGQKILTAGDAIATFTSQVDSLASAGRSLFDSTTQVGEAIDNVTAAAKKNGKTLDENTEKGRNNRGALSELASALVANYDAYVQVNGEGIKSNGVAASNRSQFIKLATQFHLSKSAAGALATQMGLIPAKKNTSFTANTHDAAARIQALKEQIANLKNRTVTVTLVTAGSINKARLGKNGPQVNGAFDATQHFAAAAAGSGLQRSGGPLPVDLFSDVTSNLYLDGKLVYANTARQVRAASKRDAWRQKVGRR